MNNDFYYVYDDKIYKFLKSMGIKCLFKAKCFKDNVTYTVYDNNQALQDALQEYEFLQN